MPLGPWVCHWAGGYATEHGVMPLGAVAWPAARWGGRSGRRSLGLSGDISAAPGRSLELSGALGRFCGSRARSGAPSGARLAPSGRCGSRRAFWQLSLPLSLSLSLSLCALWPWVLGFAGSPLPQWPTPLPQWHTQWHTPVAYLSASGFSIGSRGTDVHWSAPVAYLSWSSPLKSNITFFYTCGTCGVKIK